MHNPEGNRIRRSVIIGAAGHIDHGKTALIRALTGIDTDRLPEEKRRGITIDLGFASIELPASSGSPWQVSFIDVPGHARFVRNMLAGTGGIDAVMLVISAEEGVKPQTREHLAICGLLGIERGIVVITKADAVTAEHLRVKRDEVQGFLRGTFLEASPIIAASAYTGAGLVSLREELARIAESAPQRSPETVFRLPIDRSFVMKGFGPVVTGSLIGGNVAAGDELAIEPGARRTKVRGIQVHGRAAESAQAGSRVALNLARVEAAELARGNLLVTPGSLRAVDCLDVQLTILPDAPRLKHRARVHFHALTSECMASATLYGAASVEPGESKLARLRLSEPIVLVQGDRFVLRQGSPVTTVGGGEVLDSHPPAGIRKAAAAEWLRELHSASRDERVWLRVARRETAGISVQDLTFETGLRATALERLTDRWIGEGRLHALSDGQFIAAGALARVQETILRELDKPGIGGSKGVKKSALKEKLRLAASVVDAALNELQRTRRVRLDGELVMLFGADSKGERGLLSAVHSEFEKAGIAPPPPDEVAARLGIAAGEMRRLMTELLREKALVRLGSDTLCVDRRALEDLAGKVRALRGQPLDVAAFKQLAGVSRKYAIPLLEYLDRERVTVKQGDRRLVL